MKVLVACEFSGIVRDAFAAKWHDAWSCDLLPTERPGNHIQDDVLKHLHEGWDLMIAHPPCTELTYAAAWKWKTDDGLARRREAFDFLVKLYKCSIPKVCIENPRGYPCKALRRPDQVVNPFDFGEFERKGICLWMKGLPPLMMGVQCVVKPRGHCIKANGRRYNYYFVQGKNGHNKSRFFPGIAKAMADQWG